MAKHHKAYDQVAQPSAGGTAQAGKDSTNRDDSRGNPGRFNREQQHTKQSTTSVKQLREKQLGSNGYQGN